MNRSGHRALVQSIQAPVPVSEGTLYVEGVPADKWDDREAIRVLVARYAVRVALELGKTKIVVRHATRAPITFDVVDLLHGIARLGGGRLPRPVLPVMPSNIATVGFRGLGAEIAPTRFACVVPAFPVTPAQKGASNGSR